MVYLAYCVMELAGSKVLCLFLAGCLLGLLFDPEDGWSTFLKHFSKLLQVYSIGSQKKVLFIVTAGRISNVLRREPLSVE
jgi:hypothetical protein